MLVSVGPSQLKSHANCAYPTDHGVVHICGQPCGRPWTTRSTTWMLGCTNNRVRARLGQPDEERADVGAGGRCPTGHRPRNDRIGEQLVADDSVPVDPAGSAHEVVTDLEQAWSRVLAGLPSNQRAWLRNSRPVTLHESTAIVAVPDDFTRGQLETRLRSLC